MIRTVQTTVIYCFETRDEGLICQSLYSNIGKDLALHGPRAIVAEEELGFCLLPVQ